MESVKSLQKAMENGDPSSIKLIMRTWMDELGYELVKEHGPCIKTTIRVSNSSHSQVKYLETCKSSKICCHFTNPDSENPEGIVYVLNLGGIDPYRIDAKKLHILGYGVSWKNETWWRKRGTLPQCMEEELFIPEETNFYTVLPEEITEKLKK